jgi:hypothetical protein
MRKSLKKLIKIRGGGSISMIIAWLQKQWAKSSVNNN